MIHDGKTLEEVVLEIGMFRATVTMVIGHSNKAFLTRVWTPWALAYEISKLEWIASKGVWHLKLYSISQKPIN